MAKRFGLGHKFGEAARELFPEGRLVGAEFYQIDDALRETNELLADSTVETIFEAAFLSERTFLRADVIQRADAGGWDLWEVKSVGMPSPLHILDLAIQAYVMNGAPGVPVRKAGIIHLARGARLGNQSPSSFQFSEFSAEVSALAPVVKSMIVEAQAVADAQDAPKRDTGEHCLSPYRCPFLGSACRNV